MLCNVGSAAQRDEYLGPHTPLDRTDGLLIVSLAPRDEEVDAFLSVGAPVVLVDADHPRLPRVVIDDIAGGALATQHLLDLGHERIAFVGDTNDPRYGFVASGRRLEGHGQALAAAGIARDPELERFGPHGRQVAHRLTTELLSLPEPPTAIFAASDTQALGVLEAAGYEGVAVPDDLSVIGFDDLEVVPLRRADDGPPAAVRERPSRPGAAARRDRGRRRRPARGAARAGAQGAPDDGADRAELAVDRRPPATPARARASRRRRASAR